MVGWTVCVCGWMYVYVFICVCVCFCLYMCVCLLLYKCVGVLSCKAPVITTIKHMIIKSPLDTTEEPDTASHQSQQQRVLWRPLFGERERDIGRHRDTHIHRVRERESTVIKTMPLPVDMLFINTTAEAASHIRCSTASWAHPRYVIGLLLSLRANQRAFDAKGFVVAMVAAKVGVIPDPWWWSKCTASFLCPLLVNIATISVELTLDLYLGLSAVLGHVSLYNRIYRFKSVIMRVWYIYSVSWCTWYMLFHRCRFVIYT